MLCFPHSTALMCPAPVHQCALHLCITYLVELLQSTRILLCCVSWQEAERRAAYNCDVTYVTNSELGFDYLRDNLAQVSVFVDLITPTLTL